MKLSIALSFLAFVCFCVISASADPSAPPSSAPPRLFNNDVLKVCPNPNGLVVGNSNGCKITVGNAQSPALDNIYIGTNGNNSQVNIGAASSIILVTGSSTTVNGKTLKLGSDSTVLITATGSILSLGKDGSTTKASTTHIDATDTINIGSDADYIYISADSDIGISADSDIDISAEDNIDISATGITVTASDSDLQLLTDSGDIYVNAPSKDVYIGIATGKSNNVYIYPVNTEISSTSVAISGSSYISVTGASFNVATDSTSVAGNTFTVTSGQTSVAGTQTTVTSGTINLGNSVTTTINIGSTATTSLTLSVNAANYITFAGTFGTLSPLISSGSSPSANTACNTTGVTADGSSTNNGGSISFTVQTSLDSGACVVTIPFAGGISNTAAYVVVSPLNAATASAQPYISSTPGANFQVKFNQNINSAATEVKFSYIVLFGLD